MAITSAGISGVAGGIGGAISDFFGSEGSEAAAKGDFAAAKYYADAADIAMSNKGIAEQSTAIQEAQADRAIMQATGKQQAQVAGANLSGGTAGDLLRMSTQQGALSKAVISEQGAITANSYEQEAAGLHAQEESMIGAGNAALKASEAGAMGGWMKLLGAGISLVGMF